MRKVLLKRRWYVKICYFDHRQRTSTNEKSKIVLFQVIEKSTDEEKRKDDERKRRKALEIDRRKRKADAEKLAEFEEFIAKLKSKWKLLIHSRNHAKPFVRADFACYIGIFQHFLLVNLRI